jgi:hypothetical protein
MSVIVYGGPKKKKSKMIQNPNKCPEYTSQYKKLTDNPQKRKKSGVTFHLRLFLGSKSTKTV